MPDSEPNVGEIVLDEVRAFLGRFCKMPDEHCLNAMTLWAAHTHVTDQDGRPAFETTPRLAFLSDGPASGKTRCLDMLALLCPHAKMVIDPTPASFAISVHERRATVLIDEIDILFGAGRAKAELRSLLNSGYKRGAVWERENHVVHVVFAPVALAGLGAKFVSTVALSTLHSRTICLWLKPMPGKAEHYRPREHEPVAAMIRRNLELWAQASAASIAEDWPELPDGIEDRMAEVWEPLLMVANVAGGHWPATAAAACRHLALRDGKDVAEVETLGQRLLRDLRTVFGEDPRLSTVTIVECLRALPDSPWPELFKHAASAPRELAALLAPYGVSPVKVWENGHSLRGYLAHDLSRWWIPSAPSGRNEEPAGVGCE